MITLLVEENNPLTPDFYNDVISRLQFHQLTCPCCSHSASLSVHGYYNRFVKAPDGRLSFRICRVACGCCHHTHALLLSSMVPYSQIPLDGQAEIISNHLDCSSPSAVLENNPALDESSYRYVIRQFHNHWEQKLLSEGISFFPARSLVISCFRLFMRQFMQIRITPNLLFCNTT